MLSLNHCTLKTKTLKTVLHALAPMCALVPPHWFLQSCLPTLLHPKGIREPRNQSRVSGPYLRSVSPPPEGAAGRPPPTLTAHSSNKGTEGAEPIAKPLGACVSGLRGAGEGLPLRRAAARGGDKSHIKVCDAQSSFQRLLGARYINLAAGGSGAPAPVPPPAHVTNNHGLEAGSASRSARARSRVSRRH